MVINSFKYYYNGTSHTRRAIEINFFFWFQGIYLPQIDTHIMSKEA